MVPYQDMESSLMLTSLNSKFAKKRQNLKLVVPPVQLVSDLNYHCLAPHPLISFRVQNSGESQSSSCGQNVTMEIANSYQAIRLRQGCAVKVRLDSLPLSPAVRQARQVLKSCCED
mmetsp:Transcript_33470/g.75089  ORF Transcript_33470/g.75089 Transcript_33470/m.75089 type:complete len:116 (-) Transcript_33470:361-708(-)